MGAVTIGADRGLEVPLAQEGIVDALQGLGIFIEMTATAGLGLGNGKIAGRVEIPFGVLTAGKAKVAIVAAELGMDRTFQSRCIDLQGNLVTAPELDPHGMLVTAQALVLFGAELPAPCDGGERMGIMAACAYRGLVLLGQERGVDRGPLELFISMALAAYGRGLAAELFPASERALRMVLGGELPMAGGTAQGLMHGSIEFFRINIGIQAFSVLELDGQAPLAMAAKTRQNICRRALFSGVSCHRNSCNCQEQQHEANRKAFSFRHGCPPFRVEIEWVVKQPCRDLSLRYRPQGPAPRVFGQRSCESKSECIPHSLLGG